MLDPGKSYCFKKSNKERKVEDPNYYEQLCQQALPFHIKSEEKRKTEANKTNVNLSHILNKSDNEFQNMNHKKEESQSKRESGCKGLIDCFSNSFENKRARKNCKTRKISSRKIQSETEASDQDAKGMICYEYAKQRKKSKKKSRKEIKKEHTSNSKLDEILKVSFQVEGVAETARKKATNNSELTCTVVDNTPPLINHHKKRKRKHNEAAISNIHKKRKRKHGEAVVDDKAPSASNFQKKRKHKHSEDEKDNKNNLNVEKDVSISFSKQNKKKKTHQKSHTL